MRAWVVSGAGFLENVDRPVPDPSDDEVLVRVLACGVCRTDLHVRDHELPPHRPTVVPGHEIVGEVVGGTGHPVGTVVGIPWLRSTCGSCRFCARHRENLCPASRYTGWDADGGYAEYAVAPSAYVYPLPGSYSPLELAPLLCAGIIGFRAWRRVRVPEGGRLGIYGFGASAHLTAQVAMASGAEVHVFTRSPAARSLALSLGAASAQDGSDPSPAPLDGAILFAPAGGLVPVALSALDRGGTLAIAGIYLSEIPALNYERSLFYERDVRTVTSNTRADGRDFLAFAAEHRLRIRVSPYDFSRAAHALDDLAADRVDGVAVLTPSRSE